MSDELKPCPFCGGRANIYENKIDFAPKWSVGCGDCPANLDVCEDEKADAARCWNTRSVTVELPEAQKTL